MALHMLMHVLSMFFDVAWTHMELRLAGADEDWRHQWCKKFGRVSVQKIQVCLKMAVFF